MNPIRRICLGLALILVLGGTSCQTVRELSEKFNPSKKPAQAAYEKTVLPYVAEGSIYHGPAVELLATAMPLTPTVRRAMVIREAEAFDLDESRRRKRLEGQEAAQKRGPEVVLSVFVPDNKWNDLAGPKPDWQLYLVNARGERLSPVDRRRIKERTALRGALYYFWGRWSRLYRFRFSHTTTDGRPFLAPDEKNACLLISGAPGSTKINLKLD